MKQRSSDCSWLQWDVGYKTAVQGQQSERRVPGSPLRLCWTLPFILLMKRGENNFKLRFLLD